MYRHIFSPAAALIFTTLFSVTSFAQHHHASHAVAKAPAEEVQPHEFAIPQGLVTEHQEIHERLSALLDAPAPVGPAARKLADLLHHHFPLENAIALPPLGWLVPLASGDPLPDAAMMLEKTDSLRRMLPSMLEEHTAIRQAAAALGEAGESARSEDAVRFGADLTAHARHEEEILYPAAILVGEVLRLRSRD